MLCFFASLTAINLFHRARAAGRRSRAVWTLTAGVATGLGIWATQFIAMLFCQLGHAQSLREITCPQPLFGRFAYHRLCSRDDARAGNARCIT